MDSFLRTFSDQTINGLVIGNIYEGLTEIDEGLRVRPALAESWKVSPDGLVYTFKLRPGVTFHNGQ
ncbi:MAG: ABC transporter substrate-binding protein, partial [Caldilinea sp.]